MPVPILTLPTELQLEVCKNLDDSDLFNLAVTCRAFQGAAEDALKKSVLTDPHRASEVLLWAVEKDRQDLFNLSLNQPSIDPDVLYLSPIIRSRLLDVFSAKGRSGTAGPRLVNQGDDALRKELIRERSQRSSIYRRDVTFYLDRDATRDLLDFDIKNTSRCSFTHFGPHRDINSLGKLHYWHWNSLHLAVYLGKIDMAKTLLSHGADVDATCCGLCDCTLPGQDAKQELGPNASHPIWTPLHLAICTGNTELIDLLLDNGASRWVGTMRDKAGGAAQRFKMSWSALHDAAWCGDVGVCELLLSRAFSSPRDLERGSRFIYQCDTDANSLLGAWERMRMTALGFAAASGNIKTVGRVLLDAGAKVMGGQMLDPLRVLARTGRYADAMWLLDHAGGGQLRKVSELKGVKAAAVKRVVSHALWEACVGDETRASWRKMGLRACQNDKFEFRAPPAAAAPAPSPGPSVVVGSEASRLDLQLRLAKRLLAGGADPNTHPYPLVYPPSLAVAMQNETMDLAALLLESGARLDVVCPEFGGDKPHGFKSWAMAAAFCVAHRTGNLDAIDFLLEKGASLRTTDYRHIYEHRGSDYDPRLYMSGNFPARLTSREVSLDRSHKNMMGAYKRILSSGHGNSISIAG
ncbi:hypothetical protein OQA88_3058 [Cercophora sp. LCS_1]